ncbi:MAG: CSLREA domain-containing protein [Acidimicrobiia bacterium]|nr:CSLREA domain-containing protein [Acidimicrobiia bacterium]
MLVDDDGVLWVTSQSTDSIIGFNADGGIETEIQTGPGSGPVDLTLGPGRVFYVAMADGGRVDLVTLLAERSGRRDREAVVSPFIADGLVTPTAVAIGPDGALWVTDHWSGTIRRFDLGSGDDLGFGPEPPEVGTSNGGGDRLADASFGPTDLAFLPTDAPNDETARFAARGPEGRAFTTPGRSYDAVVRATGATVTTTGGRELAFRVIGAAADKRGRVVAASRRGDPAPSGVSDVWFDQVRPGVDLVWTSDGDELEYSFVLSPGTDPDDLALDFGSSVEVWVDGDGNAVLGDTGLLSTAPVTYQDTPDGRTDIASRYRFRPDGTVGFHVERHDPTLPLIIDPTFRSAASASDVDDTITIARPAGVTADDVLLASIAQPSSSSVTPPAGWTFIRFDVGDGKTRQDLFYKVASGSEPASYVFALGSNEKSAGAIVAYDGVDTANPIDAHGGQGNPESGTYTAPSITTTVSGATLVGFFAQRGGGGTTPPAGMTERVDQGSGDGATEIADQLLGAAGPTGTRIASGPSTENVGQLVALRPMPDVTVNSTGDSADNNAGDGICDTGATNSQGAPECTLRAAIQEANASATIDTIEFAMPVTEAGHAAGVWTISPGSGLPAISAQTTVDGTTQTGWVNDPVVRVDGNSAGGATGLSFGSTSDGSTVDGLMITRFSVDGVYVSSGADGVTVTRSWIGSDGSGSSTMGNGDDGVDINGVNAVVSDSVVNHSTDEGIDVRASGATITGTMVGLEADGTSGAGNTDVGIAVFAGGTTIGGTGAGEGNVISLNWEGIEINSSNNVIQGNKIGTASDGTTNRGNDTSDGIEIQSGTGNLIGGTAAGAGNVIAFNQVKGVNATGGNDNTVLGNTMHSNGGLGIDLSTTGVTANDAGDGDTGANDRLNFPVLTGPAGAATTLDVDLDVPAGNYRIEVFTNPTVGADPSGHGEGETLVHAETITHTGSGVESFTLTGMPAWTAGDVITATATEDLGGGSHGATSEFSQSVTATASNTVTFQQGTDGYAGAVDTFVAADFPDTDEGANVELQMDASAVAQGLVRFEGIVGNGAGQIPPGSTVTSASLTLHNRANASQAGAVLAAHRMLTSWLSSSTWNTLGSGVQLDGIEAEVAADGSTAANIDIVDGTVVVSGLEQAVQAWVDGAANHGWVLTLDNNDGWDGHSADGPTVALRPTLTVTYGGSSFAVNSTGDGGDANPGDGVCDTGGTNSEGADECTLRAAIGEANASGGATIDFAIPTSDPGYSASPLSYTFAPASPYPLITAPTVLDATTQTGYSGDPIIELDGTGAVGASGGLILRSDDSTIRGFAVHSFVDEGLEIDGSTGFGDNNTLQNNWVGLDAGGTVQGNGDHGILVTVDALDNLIGGTGANHGNVIAGSTSIGVLIRTNSTGNAVLGNSVYANSGLGIDLEEDGVTLNDAGDPDTGSNNLLNYPVISSAEESGGTVTVTFDLDVPANPDGYRVEFFTNPNGADPSGNGEGEQHVSAVTVSPGTGLTHNFAGSIGDVITATATAIDSGATSGYGPTSEYSPAVTTTDGIGVPTTTVTFRQGENGYTGTVDTWISSNVPNQDNSADVLLQIDDSPVQHGLIRFDDIIGPGAGQIPTGATILSADLIFEASDPSTADASLYLYRVLRSWVETDTWNSLLSGISTDNVEANSVPDTVHTGGLDLINTPITVGGLEAAVQAWVDGDANRGWLLTLDQGNGWDARSSENADVAGRPRLEVTYLVGPVTHVVNSTGDSTDSNPGDAVCDTGGTNSTGDPECTLRAAIVEANAFPTADIINFAMPATEGGHSGGVWTITPGSALATLSDQVTIDGSTQPGWTTTPVVELNGVSAGGSTDGFRITADNVTIRSLAINRFGADGIELVFGAANAVIAGNHIGVDASGTIDRGNGGRGIDLGSGSGPTTVGGTTAADRNVISGNGGDGIIVWNSNNNVIIGNHLGTDVTGNAPLGNDTDGVTLGSGSGGNIIGQPGAGNVLSGNGNDGFENDATGANNVVQANTIGLGADGDTLVPNGRYGVVIYNGANNTTIGGGGAGEGNVISGNVQSGVIIDGAGNPATTGNVISGNLIGTDATGVVDRGNGTYGIHFFAGATGNTIGGPTAADGNVISGNGSGEAGIYITGATSSANVVRHNYIGVNATGTAAIANNLHGVWINEAPSTQVLDNLISGNDVHGVYIDGVGATGAQILRNSIGTNAAQTATIPNLFDGIRLEGGSSGTTVGTPGNGNVIGGNAGHGVNINSSNGNTIRANHVGTDSGGSVDLGNTGGGVYSDAFGSSNNRIGGTTAGAGNVIAFNGVGVQLDSGDDNSILGNSVYSNTGLGIDLGGDGLSPNDGGDGDLGANDLLNFPVILPPPAGGSHVAVELDAPAGNYRIEVFANPTDGADPSGYGEGETFLGAATVTHTGSGVERFTVALGSGLAMNDVLAATTTEDLGGGSYGSTSEFSAAATVGPAAFTVTSTGDSPDNDPGDGYCYTGALNSEGDPECTLRAAISEVNALGLFNVDTDFAIPTSDGGYAAVPRPHWTIAPVTPLPAVTAYHDIDATTQAGWAALAPVVYLDGSASAATDLIHYSAASTNSLLDGMGIINAPTTAVRADVDYIYLNNLVIGLDVDGTTGAGSGGDAVVFNGQHGDVRDSVISASTGAGVRVTTAGLNFAITETYVGTGTDGIGALGNTGGGVIIDGGDNHLIGLSVRDANVIAHNSVDVQVNGTASNITIENNLIGVDLTGAGGAGSVPLEINTSGAVRVGGELSTEANTIRYGAAAGVTVTGTATASIIGNAIWTNGGLGVDLVGGTEDANGVTANDPGDGDAGPNGLLNFPVLTVPEEGESLLTVTLDVPAGDYRIEVFTNATDGADPSGHGEGETLLATKAVTHTGAGSEDFTIVVPAVSVGQVFTATVTVDLGGGSFGATSEFSAAVTVASSKPAVLDSSVRRSDLAADGGLDPATAETGGITGRALPFDGFGDRLVGPALNISDSALTLTARIRPDTLSGTSTLVSKRTIGGSPIYELTVNGAGQASAVLDVGGAVTVSGGSIGTGTWHDLVAAWDGVDVVLYVDGVEVDRTAAAGSLSADITTSVAIGNRADGTAGFDGLIDHVDVTHDPLTVTEVGLRYANTVAGTLTVTVGQQQTAPPGPWTVTTGQSRSGTYALAAPVTVDASSAAWAVATGIDEPGVVFESWWWITSTTGVDLASGTRAGAAATDQFDAAFISGSDWALRRRFGATTDTDGTGTLAPSTGTWVKVEQWTDQNGNSRLIVDGTEVITWTGQTAPPASGSVGFRVGQLPGGQVWYIDDPRARKLISPEPVATLGPLDRD